MAKKWLLTALIGLVLMFYAIQGASASTLLISIGSTVSNWYALPTSDYLGQVFYTNISAFVDYGHFSAYWAYDGSANNTVEGGLWDINGNLIATSTVGIFRSGYITFDIQIDKYITSGFYYFGLKNVSASYGQTVGSVGITEGTVGGGDYDGGCKKNYSGTGSVGICSGADIFFQLYADTGTFIFQNYPTSATTTTDFATWYVGYSTNSSSTLLGKVVQYATSTANLASCNTYYGYSNGCYADSEPIIARTTVLNEPLMKLNNLFPSVWYSRALITDTIFTSTSSPPYLPIASTIVLASTSPISFYVIQGDKISNYPEFTPVNPDNVSSTDWGLNCDNQGFVAGSFCNMLNYVFTPTQESFIRLTSIGDLVAIKAPLGYFTQIKNALTSGFTTSSEAIDFSAIEPLAESGSIFYYLKNSLSFLIWVLFGFWVFKKFRHITL